ncbi:hypothetical protein F2P79_005002 [Pimephales promelas]|nr:hypothetical protein F2P79_005002 [Pimephales promelas]
MCKNHNSAVSADLQSRPSRGQISLKSDSEERIDPLDGAAVSRSANTDGVPPRCPVRCRDVTRWTLGCASTGRDGVGGARKHRGQRRLINRVKVRETESRSAPARVHRESHGDSLIRRVSVKHGRLSEGSSESSTLQLTRKQPRC